MCAPKFVVICYSPLHRLFHPSYVSENHFYAYKLIQNVFLLRVPTTGPAQADSPQQSPNQPLHCHSCPFQPLRTVVAESFQISGPITSLVNTLWCLSISLLIIFKLLTLGYKAQSDLVHAHLCNFISASAPAFLSSCALLVLSCLRAFAHSAFYAWNALPLLHPHTLSYIS